MFSPVYIIIILVSSLFTLSSSSWFWMWAGLEVNLLGFVPLMIYYKFFFGGEACCKYFLTQSAGSSILVFSMAALKFNFLMLGLILLGLMMKLGLYPFCGWLLEISSSLSWVSMAILVSWQKVAPLHLLSHFSFNLMVVILLMTSLWGGLGGMGCNSLRNILMYSSLVHLGWVSLCTFSSGWTVYYLIYMNLSFILCMSFSSMKVENLSDIMMTEEWVKVSIFLQMLSLGGLPPLAGFYMKWWAIKMLIMNSLVIIMGLLFSTFMSIYYYLKVGMLFCMNMKVNIYWGGSGKNKIDYGLWVTVFLWPMCKIFSF